MTNQIMLVFFFSSRRRHTSWTGDWSSECALPISGRLVIEHRPACAFDVSCFRDAMLGELHILTVQNYSYPPSALFVAIPFAVLPYYVALAVWTLCGDRKSVVEGRGAGRGRGVIQI